MASQDPNQREWENPANWSGGVFGIYRSDRDSRTWVPKRNPRMGWTLNFSRRLSWLWLAGLVAGPIIVMLLALQWVKPTH